MNMIHNLLAPDNILIDLPVTSKKRFFEEIATLIEKNNQIDRSLIFESLFAREKLGSTGLGQGIAIPHGRIKGLREPIGAFVRLANPIEFDAPDARPVQLLFVLLVPSQATTLHLQILGELAQMFSEKLLRDRLLTNTDPTQIHQLLTQWQNDAPAD